MSLHKISHSMADAYMSCQKKFEYAHIKKIMPVTTPEALARGIYGHKIMELFFTAIKEGTVPSQAKSIAFLNAMDDPKYFNKIWNRIEHFIDEIYPTLGWVEVISIECTYRLDVGTRFQFPFTVDLVVRLESGEVAAIDFKFGADAYSDEMLQLYPQLPKYVGGLRILGANGLLDHEAPTLAFYVFIRSRANIADKTKFVEIHEVKATDVRIRNSFIEQDRVAAAIIAHEEDASRPYPRTFNNNCKYCPFIDLCIAEMNGKDSEQVKTMEDVLYTTNTYGYDLEEVV